MVPFLPEWDHGWLPADFALIVCSIRVRPVAVVDSGPEDRRGLGRLSGVADGSKFVLIERAERVYRALRSRPDDNGVR
jgi:hypothetical protein